MDEEREMIRKWERKFSQKRKRARDMASFPAAVRRERGKERKEGKRAAGERTERKEGKRRGRKWPFVMT